MCSKVFTFSLFLFCLIFINFFLFFKNTCKLRNWTELKEPFTGAEVKAPQKVTTQLLLEL